MHPYPGWSLLNNTNRFLQYGPTLFSSEHLDYYEGIKTGSTDAAGNNLVAAAKTRSGRELISGNPFIYSRTLLESAAAQIEPSVTPKETTAGTDTPETTGETAATSPTAATDVTQTASETSASSGPSVSETGGNGGSTGTFLLNIDPWLAAFLIMTAIALTVSMIFGAYVRKIRQERRLAARIRRVRRR